MLIRRSLKLQLALGAMLLGLVLVVTLSLLQFHQMQQTLSRQVEADQAGTVNELARLLDEKLEERVGALRAAAKALPQPLSADLTVLEGHLRNQAALLTLYDDLYIFDPKGVLLVDWPVKPGRRALDMSSRDYIQGVIGNLDAYISKPILGKATQQPIVVVAVPIQDGNGALKGILGGVLNLYKPNLLGSLPSRKNGETGYFYLVGPDRTVIAHPDKALILKSAGAVGTNPALDEALQGFEGSLLAARGSSDERLETFRKLQTNGWVLAAVLPTREAYAPIEHIRLRMIVTTGLMLAVMLPLLWIFTKRLLQPLSNLAEAMQGSAQHIQPGVSARPVAVLGAPEIQTVAHAFNDFLAARNDAEALLAASEQRMSLLVEHVSDGIWDWDIAYRRIFLNPAMRNMLGLGPTDAVSADDLDRHIHPDDLRSLVEAREACLRGAIEEFACEHRMRASDGRWMWVQASGVVVARDGRGHALRMIGTVVDISTRREQIDTLAAAKAHAEAASAAKSNFLANMSHEIRTPMNGVMGMTQLCLQTELTPQQRSYLEMVDTSARSLLAVIDDILDFSKIEAHKLDLDIHPFSLQDTLVGACRNLSLRAAEKGLALVLDASPHLPAVVHGDAGRVQQVLTNLIGNAIKFTPSGHVAVSATLRHDTLPQPGRVEVEIAVTDTGIGIPADKLALVFDAFTQADATTTRQFGGTGLGLSISRSLVRMMGGDIHASSKPGEGSCFTFHVSFELPADATDSQLPATPVAHTVAVRMADPAQRASVVHALTTYGAQVLPADTPEQLAALATMATPLHCLLVDAGQDRTTLPVHLAQKVVQVGNLLQEASAHQDVSALPEFLRLPLDHRELLRWLYPQTERAAPPPAAPASPTEPATEETAPALSILVAEDNLVNQKLILAVLNKLGHRTELAVNGLEAVKLYASRRFDVVLMDIQMPEMGGLEATARIRDIEQHQGNGRHTPIIALTANALKGDRETYLASGMDGYVSKPLSVAAIQAEIQRLTGTA